MGVVLTQRMEVPLDPPLQLGATVRVDGGFLAVVTGVYRPPDDGMGGVLVEVTSLGA